MTQTTKNQTRSKIYSSNQYLCMKNIKEDLLYYFQIDFRRKIFYKYKLQFSFEHPSFISTQKTRPGKFESHSGKGKRGKLSSPEKPF